MTEIDASHRETLHVFAFDGTLAEAAEFASDAGTLGEVLGGVEITPGRAEAVDTAALADLGLSAYLIEGLAAEAGPVRADAGRLDGRRGATIILLPGAVAETMRPRTPLSHLGSYPLVAARGPGAPLHSPSAERQVTADEPEAGTAGRGDSRRASGIVAMAALAAAFLVVLVVWLVAAA